MNDYHRLSDESDLPRGLSEQGRQGLISAGYTWLEQVATLTEGELKMIHGMGPHEISLLRSALAERNLSLDSDQLFWRPSPLDFV